MSPLARSCRTSRPVSNSYPLAPDLTGHPGEEGRRGREGGGRGGYTKVPKVTLNYLAGISFTPLPPRYSPDW